MRLGRKSSRQPTSASTECARHLKCSPSCRAATYDRVHHASYTRFSRIDGGERIDPRGYARDRQARSDPQLAWAGHCDYCQSHAFSFIILGQVWYRHATASYEKGVTALGYGEVNVKTAFLTHMHSDHTVGYPDLIL